MSSELAVILFIVSAAAIIVNAIGKYVLIAAALAAGFWIFAYVVVRIAEAVAQPIHDKKQRKLALIRRAEQQHNAMMSGNLHKGIYGEYMPPKELR